MKNIPIRITAVVLSCTLLLSQPVSAMPLESLLEITNEKHQSVKKPDVDFEAYINSFSTAPSKYEALVTDSFALDGSDIFTYAQIEEDTNDLFGVLSAHYGGYAYFGGEETFEPARQAILKDCQALDVITNADYIQILQKHLAFIEDGHFMVVGQFLHDWATAYMYQGADYRQSADGFIHTDTGLRVTGIDNTEDWASLFKMFINNDGDIVYRPVIIATENPGEITVQYEDGAEEALSPSSYYGNYQETMMSGFGDIPIIRIASMGFDQSNNGAGAQLFLAYAEQYKDAPVLIVDLRNNGGGNGLLPLKWMMAYTGQFVPTNYPTLKYMSDDALRQNSLNTDSRYYIPYEELTEIGGFTPISAQYMKSNAQPDKFVNNEQLLVVLTNKNTASSAELFVDLCHNVENTLIVGTNTTGMLVGDAATSIALPHTGVFFQIGNGISFFPENYFKEFAGFEPDLWVDGNAEEMIIKYLQKHMNQVGE